MDFSSLDSLSTIIQSQNKAFSVFKAFLIALLFMSPPAACKACVIFVSVIQLRSQVAILYSALSTSQCLQYSVPENVHNNLKYYSPLPFGVCI